MLVNTTTFILPKFEALILFKQIFLPNSYNFLFHLFSQLQFILYIYLIDHTIFKVLVKSNVDYSIQIYCIMELP